MFRVERQLSQTALLIDHLTNTHPQCTRSFGSGSKIELNRHTGLQDFGIATFKIGRMHKNILMFAGSDKPIVLVVIEPDNPAVLARAQPGLGFTQKVWNLVKGGVPSC